MTWLQIEQRTNLMQVVGVRARHAPRPRSPGRLPATRPVADGALPPFRVARYRRRHLGNAPVDLDAPITTVNLPAGDQGSQPRR